MHKITFYFLASLCMTLGTYASNSADQFSAEVIVIVTSSNGNEEIKFNFSSEDDLKNFDFAQIGTEQLSYVDSILISVDSGGNNENHATFKMKLSKYNHAQKINMFKVLRDQALYALMK